MELDLGPQKELWSPPRCLRSTGGISQERLALERELARSYMSGPKSVTDDGRLLIAGASWNPNGSGMQELFVLAEGSVSRQYLMCAECASYSRPPTKHSVAVRVFN